MLSDFEVFISLVKFMIAIGIFIRPFIMREAGLFNGIACEIIALVAVILSNNNLIRCLNYMPNHLTTPDQNLTYGKVVHFVLDSRRERMNRIYRTAGMPTKSSSSGNSRFFQDTLDA